MNIQIGETACNDQEKESLREIISQGNARASIDAQRIAQARPYADAIYARLLELAAKGKPNPPGPEIFPDSWKNAETWNKRTDMTVPDRVWLIAMLDMRLTEHLQPHLQCGC